MSKLIIWDLDGTLVNSMPVTFEAFNDGIEAFLGRRLLPSEIKKHFGPAEDEVVANIVGRENAAKCYEIVCQSLIERLQQIAPFDGIIEALEALKSKGHQSAIFTGRGRLGTDIILNHLSWQTRFDLIVTSNEVKNTKPHPEGIFQLCKKLNFDPHDAIMIGDSPLDVKAGKDAGAETLGCVWDTMANQDALIAAKPALVVTHPKDVEAFICERILA